MLRGCGMTPEEIGEALNQRGMVKTIAEVSGWNLSYVSRIRRDGWDAVAPHIVADIMQALPRAQKILQERKEGSTYHGAVCSHCGGTLRCELLTKDHPGMSIEL